MRKAFVKYLFLAGIVSLSACRSDEPTRPTADFGQLTVMSSTPYDSIGRTDALCDITIEGEKFHYYEMNAAIHLRGNSTAQRPKHPFLLKLHSEPALFHMPSAKSWVLLPDYIDRTLLRSALAFRLGADSKLRWSPRWHFVEMSFNGEAKGPHVLCEKVQVHPNRVRLPDDGWLVEIDAWTLPSDISFTIPHIERPVHVHYPYDSVPTPETESIKALFAKADEVLFSANFTDFNEGWRRYLDEESWIDWFWINEISKNNDAFFFSSCFMHSSSDGKIAMGPIWDFDLAFGNTSDNGSDSPEGWYIRNVMWYTRLFEDPSFATAAKQRFDWFYARKQVYLDFVRSNARMMKPHADANNEIWHNYTQQIAASPNMFETYDEHVDALIAWLEQRFEWIKANL